MRTWLTPPRELGDFLIPLERHHKDGPSDGHAVPEKFVVFVVATLSRA